MKRKTVSRFSVSLPPDLRRELDRMTREKGYNNRSLAIGDMIRDRLVEHHAQFGKGEIAGTITLVYDHHKGHVQKVLTTMQHDHPGIVIAAMHVHLDHDNCLEVLVARGNASGVKKMADQLIAAKGVKHGRLTVTTTGGNLPP
jgi:CopG family transcriptional regulator, nickel-responsive regulator